MAKWEQEQKRGKSRSRFKSGVEADQKQEQGRSLSTPELGKVRARAGAEQVWGKSRSGEETGAE